MKTSLITGKSVLTLSAVALLLAACDNPAVVGDPDSGPATVQEGTAYDAKDEGEQSADCEDLPDAKQLKKLLRQVPNEGEAGGLFSGKREWAAVVNRNGQICAAAVSTEDPAAAWPGALGIAKAKAFTANAFSTDLLPLSTARLYTLSQPGQPLYGAASAHPMNPLCFATPEEPVNQQGRVCGGTIVFGGGLALYRNKTRIGGLGVSGDTPCADHEIAKRLRAAAKLNPPQGQAIDDIQYRESDGPSLFLHPLCQNTWRNGKRIGDAKPVKDFAPGDR